jgi:oligoendopeptidase F
MPKTRDQIDQKDKWNIEDIYVNNDIWEQDFEKLKTLIPTLDSKKNSFTESADALFDAFKAFEIAEMIGERLYVYAKMRRDEDNNDSLYQGMTDRALSINIQMSSALSFIRPELLKKSDQQLRTFLDENHQLKAEYGYYIDSLLRAKSHILSEKEEKLLSMTSEFSSGAKQIFTMLNNADIIFGKIDDDGEQKELTHATYATFMQSENRQTRKNAYRGIYQKYKENINTIAATYSTSVKKDVFFAKARNYKSALSGSLYSDKVPDSLYDNLIKVMHDNADTMYDYIALRKKVLGIDDLKMYDLYTPLVADLDMKFSYDEAKAMVKKALLPLGDDYQKLLNKSYNDGWIDVYENTGKLSGAYSWGTYGVHPYVLLNHRDDLNSVYTLAHELGHAIHTWYANDTQSHTNSNYTIFVAEVASTVNEILLTKYLLSKETDKEKRKYILNHYIDQFKGTVVRQTMFAEFEKITHAMQESGQPLTAESLSAAYSNLNKQYYGEHVNTDDNIAVEWARIPHFYNAFYVYKYATGFASAISIVNSIEKDGMAAVNKYKNFLKGGGSDYPLNLLKIADVDLESGEPVDVCMKEFRRALDEFSALF